MMRRAAAFCLIVALAQGLALARAADLQRLVQETQHIAQTPSGLTLVWWMPPAFWQASLDNNPALSPSGRAQVMGVLNDYMIFAILHAKLSAGGILDANTKTDLLSNARLQIGGKTIEPVPPESIVPTAQGILLGLKPALANMLGKLGQSMELVLYPSRQNGVPLVDASKAGGFTYTLYDQTFSWRLPLGSLLPPKIDAKTHEQFPGNYLYNPYTGERLGAN